jgi:protein SCO1/2
MLCNQILTGVASGLRPLSLRPGHDFDVVAISINPAEIPADATAKRDFVTHRYSNKSGTSGWHFLVGDQPAIHAVADAVGFHYRYDVETKMFFHASGVMAVTPQGKLARYFYGVDYEPKDLKLGLIEASNNSIGSVVDQILLFCYHYDPNTGKYGAVVMNILRATAVVGVVILAIALTFLWRRDVREHRQVLKEASHL